DPRNFAAPLPIPPRSREEGGDPMSESSAAGDWRPASTETGITPKAPRGPMTLQLPCGDRVVLDRSVTVGKAEGNGIVLSDTWVSRKHCAIEVLAGRARVRDLGSKNGTYVNGLRVAEAELQPGTLLCLGRSR